MGLRTVGLQHSYQVPTSLLFPQDWRVRLVITIMIVIIIPELIFSQVNIYNRRERSNRMIYSRTKKIRVLCRYEFPLVLNHVLVTRTANQSAFFKVDTLVVELPDSQKRAFCGWLSINCKPVLFIINKRHALDKPNWNTMISSCNLTLLV